MCDTTISSDVLAAIAMGLYDEMNQHDPETNVLTIKREPQEYLPWADKSVAMLQMPIRK